MSDFDLITGGAGFIGAHLLASYGPDPASRCCSLDVQHAQSGPAWAQRVDIRDAPRLGAFRDRAAGAVLLHLAAKAEVVMPFSALSELMSTNVDGTLTLLAALAPRHVVFASSSSVYGNTSRQGSGAGWAEVNPLGAYAASKVTGELAIGDWVRETGGTAVSLRFGNVVGPACRGLIPYLVAHAVAHPDGRVPARMRGDGRIVRDYVPVETVVAAVRAAAACALRPGTALALNVGTGRGMTNGEVAVRVARVLAGEGYRLCVDTAHPVAPGEALVTVLNSRRMESLLAVPVPDAATVGTAVEASVLYWLSEYTRGRR